MTERERIDAKAGHWMLQAATQTSLYGEHYYVSTACVHGRHAYCAADVGMVTAKKPHTCKFCDAQCMCYCHEPNVVGTAAEQPA